MDRYQAKLLRYGRRFLAQDDHIVDVVQDVFIKTYENIQSFDATRKFSPWIYRIAHNAFVNEIRQKKARTAHSIWISMRYWLTLHMSSTPRQTRNALRCRRL